MQKNDFIKELTYSITYSYEGDEKEIINKIVEDSVKMSLEIANLTDYLKLEKISGLSKENYVKLCSLVCGILNLKSNMTSQEELAYKIVKEKGKSLDDNFTSLIKESTARLQGAMFYGNN